VDGIERPPREAHFDPAASGLVYVTLWTWNPIRGGSAGKGDVFGWWSRGEQFVLPRDLAKPTAAAWAALRVRCVWTAHEKGDPETQLALPGVKVL
jgi:hypothetical protein